MTAWIFGRHAARGEVHALGQVLPWPRPASCGRRGVSSGVPKFSATFSTAVEMISSSAFRLFAK